MKGVGKKNKFFTTLLAAACAAGLSAGELKIVKAAYGNGEQVNDVTEAFLKHAGGLPGTFLTITPSNKFFAPDPAPRKAKTLTVTYTDGGAEKSVRIPERQFGVVAANADPAQEFKVLRAFYGSGREWKEVTDKILPVIENNTILGINNTTLGPDPAPRKKKELLVIYTQDNQVRFLQIPEKTDFSVDCFQKK